MDISLLLMMTGTSLAAGTAYAVCGFGFGTVVMAVWPYFMGYSQAVAVTALSSLLAAVWVTWQNRQHVRVKTMLSCALTALVCAVTAVHFSVGASDVIMRKALGAVLLILSFYSIFLGGKIHFEPSLKNGMIAGAVAGTCSGLFAVGGAPASIYMLAATNTKEEYRATLNAHFCFTTCSSSVARLMSGIITTHTLELFAMSLVGMGVGIFLGNKIFRRLNGDLLRKIIYGYIAFSGVLLLVR